MSRRQWKILGVWFVGLLVSALVWNAFMDWVLNVPFPAEVFASIILGALYSLLLPPTKVIDW